MLANVARNVASQLGYTLQLAPAVRDTLLELVCRDLSQGGRGIGNQLESLLINPLARALFQQAFPAGATITVTALEGDGALRSVVLEQAGS
jgi:ATP-dependent Clp protease ATP-binding subunit ClpA